MALFAVNAVSAADNTSDIVASDASVSEIGLSQGIDESLGAADTFVITNQTFGNYFTADGELNDNVSAGSTLDFQGTFTGEAYKVNITKPVNIISSTEDAVFNEIGKKGSTDGGFHISAGGSGTNVRDINFINSTFYVNGASDVSIENINMEYVLDESYQAYVIYVVNATNLTMAGSYFFLNSKTSGKEINNIIYVAESSNVLLDDNEIYGHLPSCYVDWKEFPPASGSYVKSPVSEGVVIDRCSNFTMSNNEIMIKYTDVVGDYDTLYAVDIIDSEKVKFVGNNIHATGHTYIYGLYVEANDLLIDNNGFEIESDENYANAIEIEASKDAIVANNEIYAGAPNLAYSVYSGMNGGDLRVNYFNNTISAFADIVYGMELCGTYELVSGNTITVKGNQTTAIAAKSKSLHVKDNTINALGENLGNSTTTDSFEPMTAGIHVVGSESIIEQNTINSNSRGIVVEDEFAFIERNVINVTDNGLDDSYAVLAEGADVTLYNNTITYVGHTAGKKINNAVNLKGCIESIVQDNKMDIFIPSCYVEWREVPPASDIWVKFPVSEGLVFNNCSDLELNGNEINVEVNEVVGAFDTIYCIDIKDSKNVDVSANSISGVGCSYIYGLYTEADDSVIDNNSFIIKSDNYANGIEVEASTNTVISSNYIDVESPSVAYGIYSGMNGGDLMALYLENTIIATSDIVYGMELCGTGENVGVNLITVFGNKTTGIAAKSKQVNIFNNVINALGENLGNSTTTDSFEPMTAGIHVIGSPEALIEENIINSNSRGIVVENTYVDIMRNEINVTDNGLDDSYGIFAEGADIAIVGNNITYVGNTDGKTINNALNLKDCIEPIVRDNSFNIAIPSCYVDWKEVPPASGIWVKFPVSEGLVFNNCSDLDLSANAIGVEVNNVIGAFDTIYCIDIKDSENVNVSANFISGVGCSYIYGLYIEANDSSVDDNSFIIKSDNYANGIEIEASINTEINNNYIDVESPSVAYGIYSGMNGGDLEVEYFNNTILATSDIVYGMELCGTGENVQENVITVMGNKTTGIAAKSDDINIFVNEINVLGENLGNSTTTDSFTPMTVGIHLLDAKARIDRNTIVSNSRGIVAENGLVSINGNEITVADNGLDDSYGILAEGTDIAIFDNNMTYVGSTEGNAINNAVNLKDCIEPLVQDNIFDIFIPSCYVDWKEVPPSSGNWVKFPVSEGLVFTNCSDLELSENEINVEVNEVIGAFDTIYCIDIKDSENVEVSDNLITGVGCSYIYGLYIEANDSSVDNNSFIIGSDNYANGIEIEASRNTVISNNYIGVESPSVVYGIYSGMNGGDLEVGYFNNTILATSDIVYGMELCGTSENVQGNLIVVTGNKTTGIAAKSDDINIFVNEINALGENLGNSTTTDSFTPMTVGIHLLGANATVDRNTINSNSRGIVVENGRLISNRNVITVEDNGLDDSYGILAEGTDILIFDSNITYVGNTTGETINNAINLKDCFEPFVMDNEFNITLPSCYVDWKQNPDGSWVSSPISEGIVIDSADLSLLFNNIVLNYDGVVGDYDTIYAVDIKSDNSSIKSNKINANGHSYIYGLLISGENFTVENNTMNVMSDDFYANGIDIEGPASGVVKDNIIATNAKGVVYPIYSAMSNGNITADYVNNNIIAYAQTAYAMELAGLKENVEGNTILIGSNTTIGIYSFSKDINVNNNTMYLLSNDTSSTAFLGKLGNATITDNKITVMGEYTIDVSACEALVKDNNLKANELTGDASVNYDPDTSSVYNNTPKMDKYFLTTEGLQKYYGNTTPLEFILTDASGKPVSNKTVIITINGQNYTRITDVNGTARININLNAGNYEVNATYLGEGYNLTETAEVEILSTIEGNDITKIYRNGTQYYATFIDSEGNLLKNTDVNFNINGVFYTRKTNENGTARLNINLNPGKYVITVYNTKTKEQTANNITVLSSIVDNSDLTKYYRNASQYVVKILDDTGNPVGAGKNVTFNINGVFYTRQTNASGEVKININLQPGKYVITANYNGCMVSNSITVLPTLVTKDLAMKYRDGSTFNATVLDGQGKPLAGQNVEFNINGVLYSRTSGSDGIAKLNINLMQGNYIITSSYNGYSIGNKVTISG